MARQRRDDSRRVSVTLDGHRLAILEGARPDGGTLSDAVAEIIDIACRADAIERQSRALADALTVAMGEMAATLTEIRTTVAHMAREDR